MSSVTWRRTFSGLNVVLVVTALVLAWRDLAPAPTVAAAPGRPMPPRSSARKSVAPHYPAAGSAREQRRWLIDQLRAMGVPNAILARVVMKDLDQRWNKRAA